MRRRPRPGDSRAHHAYDSDNPDEPDRDYKPREPDAAHDFREPYEFREPNDKLCDSNDNDSCYSNDSHEPGELDRVSELPPAVRNSQRAVHDAPVSLHAIERKIQPRNDFRL